MSAQDGDIEFRLLGAVRAWRGGTELPLGTARRTAVLCVLALNAGHSVTREQLIAAVWGEDAPASAKGNVYTYVSSLRQILEPARGRWAAGSLLTSGGGTYQLHVSPESVDVIRFEALRETARRHRTAGDTAAELATLESALGLWHGEALAGVPGPFAEAQRLRLSELRLATADRHAALLAGTGRGVSAPGAPRRVTRTEPLADRATAVLGRDAEIAWLRRAAAEAARGHGRSILIEAAPGMGRSALLAAALPSAGRAAGDELSPYRPLGLLVECVESAACGQPSPVDNFRGTTTGSTTLSELARRLAEVAAEAEGGDEDMIAQRAAGLVTRAAETTPLVLVADDLHWADTVTLKAWGALSERAATLPLGLVATARSGRPAVRGVPADEVVELGPLDDEAASALAHVLSDEPLDATDLARLLADAGGSPAYLRLLATGDSGALANMVDAHLGVFTEHTRQVLRTVAFLTAYRGAGGNRATVEDLAAVTGQGADDLAGLLAPAIAAGIVLRDVEGLALRHPIVARTLHGSAPAALRITLHRSFAERIAAAGAPPERVVAQLLAGEVPIDGSVASWLAAHVEELAGRSPVIAIEGLQQARAHYGLDPDQRLLFTTWLARLLLDNGRNAAAEAGWVAVRTGDPELKGEMHWIAAYTHELRGEFETAADVAHAAIRERRVSPEWMERLRELMARVRTHLPGDPTMPHLSRATLTTPRITLAS